MKLCRCPVCHSDINLDQLLEDDAGRELLRIITELKYGVARPLVSYIALFRPEKSALSNTRAVKLMRDVLESVPAFTTFGTLFERNSQCGAKETP